MELEVRKRSVDNLQRLYTVVVALALTKASERMINAGFQPQKDTGALASLLGYCHTDFAPMFVTLLLTIVPFYHGANRFLDQTYAFASESAARHRRRLSGLVDYGIFLVEAVMFYGMAVLLPNGRVFFATYILLLMLDVVWLAQVWISGTDEFGKTKAWMFVNIVAAFLATIILFLPLADELVRWWLLAVIAVGRTLFDYYHCWDYYWGVLATPTPPSSDSTP